MANPLGNAGSNPTGNSLAKNGIRQTKSQTRYIAGHEFAANQKQTSAEGSADSRQKKLSDSGLRK